MTNEQLAASIKIEKRYELISMLWKQVQTLMYIKADKYYYYMPDKFRRAGVDIWDLRQELYLAFLDGIKAYDPKSPLKFITFLEFPIKNTIKRVLGSYTSKIEPLNNAESIDKPVSNCDDLTAADMIADENIDIFEIIENHSDSEIVRAEVEKLHGKQKIIVKLYYFHNKSDCEIAKRLGTTSSNVFQIRRRALAALRKSSILKLLYYY